MVGASTPSTKPCAAAFGSGLGRDIKFRTVFDYFGAGYSGIRVQADFIPDYVNIDTTLTSGIDRHERKQLISQKSLSMLHDLGTIPMREGIKAEQECDV
ncbi:MAG: EAL domain-containing protein [Paracoccaceae bacterium]